MFLPVSSTSHLVLMQHLLIRHGSALPPPDSPEMILFDLVVHVGTLVSIAFVFRRSLQIFLSNFSKDVSRLLQKENRFREREFLYFRLGLLGLFSVLVTAAVGLPLKTVSRFFCPISARMFRVCCKKKTVFGSGNCFTSVWDCSACFPFWSQRLLGCL